MKDFGADCESLVPLQTENVQISVNLTVTDAECDNMTVNLAP